MLGWWVNIPIVPSGTTECHCPGRHNPQKKCCRNLKSPNKNFFFKTCVDRVLYGKNRNMTLPVVSVTLWWIQTCYTCMTITVLLPAFNVSSHLIIKNLLKFKTVSNITHFTIILHEMSHWYISKGNASVSVGPSE